MNTSDDPLRDAAVERAADLERERDAVASSEAARRAKQVARDAERRAAIQALDSSAGNESSQFARVAASDYTHNNTRAMVGPDGQPFLAKVAA